MSNKLFPSMVKGLVREGKLLGFQFAPQGSSAPLITSGAGLASVVRNGVGNFTLALQNQFRALVSCLTSVQLASSSNQTAYYVWTDATDFNTVTFAAGSAFPGTLGNSLKVVVATGVALANSIATSGGITTVTITIDTTVTTPALLATYVNTTAAAALSDYITIPNYGGTTAFTVFLASTALASGTNAGTLQAIVTAANATGGGTAPQAVTIQIQDGLGNAVDIAANAGNLVNCLLYVKSAGTSYAAGAVE